MHVVVVDLRAHLGSEIRVRVVDGPFRRRLARLRVVVEDLGGGLVHVLADPGLEVRPHVGALFSPPMPRVTLAGGSPAVDGLELRGDVMVIIVVVVHQFPQPWRGIVDAGVVVGLGWGVVCLWREIIRHWRQGTPWPSDLPHHRRH